MPLSQGVLHGRLLRAAARAHAKQGLAFLMQITTRMQLEVTKSWGETGLGQMANFVGRCCPSPLSRRRPPSPSLHLEVGALVRSVEVTHGWPRTRIGPNQRVAPPKLVSPIHNLAHTRCALAASRPQDHPPTPPTRPPRIKGGPIPDHQPVFCSP